MSSSGYLDLLNKAVKQVVLHEKHHLNHQPLAVNSVEEFELIDEKMAAFSWPLRWYHWLWAGLPMLLVFKSVILGVFLGLAATHWNGKILKSGRKTAVKFILVLLVSGTAIAIHLLLTST